MIKAITRGFENLPCLACGETDCMSIELADVLTVHCGNCETEFTATKFRATVESWTKVFDWLETAPVIATEAPRP